MSRPTLADLHELLRQELVEQMTAAGWTVDVAFDTRPGGITVGAFRRAIADDFSATADFPRTSLARELPLELTGTVGVSYEPAYRLWPAVTERECSDATVELVDLLDLPDELAVTLSVPGNVARAVEELVGPVLEHAVRWAQQYASIDALIEYSRADADSFSWEIEVVPLLLAAAGRHDDARAALARYQASGREEVTTREYRRFSFQLTRWLDGGAVLPGPPEGPVGERPRFAVGAPSFGDLRRESRARREAVRAVWRARRGKDREQLRAMLTAELGRQGLTATPLQIESQLDAMLASAAPRGRGRVTFRGLKGLVGVAKGMRTLLDEGVAPTPEWLEPPPRASYPVPANRRDWLAVPVDPAAGAWLDRALADAPMRMNDTVTLDAWLAWDPEPRTAGSRLAVHIGDQRVALLDAVTEERYRPEMAAAARRDELPLVRARVTQLHDPPRHLLELAAPLPTREP